ncbi:MAG TPA: hypothetical protein PLH72_00995 [Vicinamibacterales bacterium]|nr:hypothetical protein [Vicinamibacterales bacterium]
MIATPVVEEELSDRPFGGVPAFFPVQLEPEAVFAQPDRGEVVSWEALRQQLRRTP